MKPKKLFVSRPLLNADDIREWAKNQGFESTLSKKDIHVTIAYSKEPFDWGELTPKNNKITIVGGKRVVKKLGNNDAVALCFVSKKLEQRWQEIKDAGASYDFKSYLPHITISYKNVDIKKIIPYKGALIFGHEKFKKITNDWSNDLEEDDL